jgi:hypothetical protein
MRRRTAAYAWEVPDAALEELPRFIAPVMAISESLRAVSAEFETRSARLVG